MTQRTGPKFVGAQYVLLALVWGASFFFIKVALDSFNPIQIMVGRLLLGAAFLALVMVITRRKWPRGWRTWRSLLFISVFLAVIPFTLYAWAGQHIPSGLSSIYNATTPIATLVFTLMLLPEERFTRSRFMGLLIGAVGVVMIAAPWTITLEGDGTVQLLAQLACLGANACYAISYVMQRRFLRNSQHDPTAIGASQITLAAGIGLIAAPFLGGIAPITPTPAAVTSLVLLGVLGTGFAYIWVNNIIVTWGPTPASTVTYIVPAVGVVLGVVVLGEVMHWNEPVGGLIILVGVLFSQGLIGDTKHR